MSRVADQLDVLPAHQRIVADILAQHVPEYEVRAFGSRVNGTARTYSDLDIVIMADQTLSLDTMAALKEALSESDPAVEGRCAGLVGPDRFIPGYHRRQQRDNSAIIMRLTSGQPTDQ